MTYWSRTAGLAALVAAGCQATPPPSKPAAVAHVDGSHTFEGKDITLDYPPGWQSLSVEGTTLLSVRAPAGTVTVSVDYDKLNGFQSTFANLDRVVGGYTDDRKKAWCPDLAVTADRAVQVSGADGRRLTMTGHRDGKTLASAAVVVYRKGQVYILTADSDPADETDAGQVLDQIVSTVRWLE